MSVLNVGPSMSSVAAPAFATNVAACWCVFGVCTMVGAVAMSSGTVSSSSYGLSMSSLGDVSRATGLTPHVSPTAVIDCSLVKEDLSSSGAR